MYKQHPWLFTLHRIPWYPFSLSRQLDSRYTYPLTLDRQAPGQATSIMKRRLKTFAQANDETPSKDDEKDLYVTRKSFVLMTTWFAVSIHNAYTFFSSYICISSLMLKLQNWLVLWHMSRWQFNLSYGCITRYIYFMSFEFIDFNCCPWF